VLDLLFWWFPVSPSILVSHIKNGPFCARNKLWQLLLLFFWAVWYSEVVLGVENIIYNPRSKSKIELLTTSKENSLFLLWKNESLLLILCLFMAVAVVMRRCLIISFWLLLLSPIDKWTIEFVIITFWENTTVHKPTVYRFPSNVKVIILLLLDYSRHRLFLSRGSRSMDAVSTWIEL